MQRYLKGSVFAGLAVLLLAVVWLLGGRSVISIRAERMIFPGLLGPALLKQCSRPAPQNVSDFWEPSEADINNFEKDLSFYMQLRKLTFRMTPPADHSYRGQYVGILVHGKRYIYGNFYPANTDESWLEEKLPHIVCDGGAVFWGIVYDPEKHEFSDFQFNGEA